MKINFKSKNTIIILSVVSALVIVLAVLLIIKLIPNGEEAAETTALETTGVVNFPETNFESSNISDEFQPIDLGGSLELTGISSASGNFPEDGSGDFVENILCATFTNTSNTTLQYAKVNVTIGKEVFSFSITTIPAGASVHAFELSKKSIPDDCEDFSAESEYQVFFAEEPATFEDQLEFTVSNGMITVKNISGSDIDKEISVFYKNKQGNTYMGGITYRLRVNGLAAGQSINGYAPHAYENGTEIMFVQYDV